LTKEKKKPKSYKTATNNEYNAIQNVWENCGNSDKGNKNISNFNQ
jgi:hypothetical protein